MEVKMPRFILAEVNTHRQLSRNSASSRAIPVAKMLKTVHEEPFLFETFFRNQKGMAVSEPLPADVQEEAQKIWLETRDLVIGQVEKLLQLDVSKGQANRLLEPFMFQTALITATDWSNMIALRAHQDAQPEFQHVAEMMRDILKMVEPQQLKYGEWHLPLVHPWEFDEFSLEELRFISAGRCARVSYVTHGGERDPQADITLAHNLVSGGHMSPLEHQARPLSDEDLELPWLAYKDPKEPQIQETRCGNFLGWFQFRRMIPNEADFSLSLPDQL